MNILSLTGVGMSVGADRLFENATVGIEHDEKVGLVGRNGSGKSTFLRIVTGETEPDEGTVVRGRGLRISTLEQRPRALPGLTIADYLHAGHGEYAGAGQATGPAGRGAETAGPGWSGAGVALDSDPEIRAEIAQRYEAICHQLGLSDTGAQLETLSGGMLKKAALARCLSAESDFMILDEPTNHLDIGSVTWLEQRLAATSAGFLLVTHDRYILDAVCSTILEIDRGHIYRYPGNYSRYLQRREERINELDKSEQRRKAILRTELEWLHRGAKARTSKDKKRKERVGELLENGVEAEASMDSLPASQRRLGRKVLDLHGVAKRYDDVTVVSEFSHRFAPGERVGIIGPNGSGKSTFLDLIAGRTEPDQGSVVRGETTVFAYFDQTGSHIDDSLTVLEYMKEKAERVALDDTTTVSVEQFLERFLFPPSMFRQPLSRLSGGEFRRLYLVRLLAGAPNFLLLDEPTNDLDLDTLRVLEEYLDEFKGCILVVSHDRALLNRVTDSLLVFEGNGRVRSVTGNYEDYRVAQQNAEGAVPGVKSGKTRGSAKKSEGRSRPPAASADKSGGRRTGREASGAKAREEKKKLSFREKREYEQLPDEIEAAETQLESIETEFQQAVQDPEKLAERTRRYHELQALIEEKTARWEALAERADE
ncbi:MAG: ABC-F family ATP-binding cassette domain-containing protein [bacterium]